MNLKRNGDRHQTQDGGDTASLNKKRGCHRGKAPTIAEPTAQTHTEHAMSPQTRRGREVRTDAAPQRRPCTQRSPRLWARAAQ